MRQLSKRSRATFLATMMSACACGSAALAGPITAGDPGLANYTLQYGDFQVVSLQFADTATGTSNYLVPSAPGQIRNDIVVGTGAGGSFYNGVAGASMSLPGSDAPYNTENGSQVTYFRTGNSTSASDPGGSNEFSGDGANSWDISIADLRAYLNNQNAVLYFNLNENGVDDQLSGTDLLFWANVSLLDSSTGVSRSFYIAGNPLDPNGSHYGADLSALNGGPDETGSYPDIASGSTYDPGDPSWTYVHGDICINASTFLHYGKCISGDPSGSQSINQNLGANQAAFAGYNLTLDDLILNSPLYDTLQIDWRMANQDNGYEQLFILAGGTTTTNTVPEPTTISLFGFGILGLLGIGFRRRVRKQS
jgi:hypothetical protein